MKLFSSDFESLPDASSLEPDQELEHNEVWAAVRNLPKTLRESLLARFSCHPQGTSVRLLAQRTGRSRQWVYQQSKRALKEIQRELKIKGT